MSCTEQEVAQLRSVVKELSETVGQLRGEVDQLNRSLNVRAAAQAAMMDRLKMYTQLEQRRHTLMIEGFCGAHRDQWISSKDTLSRLRISNTQLTRLRIDVLTMEDADKVVPKRIRAYRPDGLHWVYQLEDILRYVAYCHGNKAAWNAPDGTFTNNAEMAAHYKSLREAAGLIRQEQNTH